MMRKHIVLAGVAALLSFASAFAQERDWHEVSVQSTAVFTKDSEANGITQHTTNSGGFLANYRFHFNRWLAAEGNYGYNRNAHQHLTLAGPFGLQANAHQTTGALVVTLPSRLARVEPYVLGGAGAVVFDPRGSQVGTVGGAEKQTKGAFVYGGGANVNLSSYLSLRMEYRGLVYKRPDFGLTLLDSDATAHTAQPSVGFSFRF
jgi:opacity protein-like surface antigen